MHLIFFVNLLLIFIQSGEIVSSDTSSQDTDIVIQLKSVIETQEILCAAQANELRRKIGSVGNLVDRSVPIFKDEVNYILKFDS